jgi:hypothetical protein
MENPRDKKISKKGSDEQEKSWFIEKYEKYQEEKAVLQEEYHKKRLFAATERLKNSIRVTLHNYLDQTLSYNQKFELSFFLKSFFTPEDLGTYEDLKKKYHYTVNFTTACSLVNVVLVAAAWKKFLTLKSWQKMGTCVGVFFVSHYSGLWSVKKEASAFHAQMIEKYKAHIDEIKFEDIQELKRSLPKRSVSS